MAQKEFCEISLPSLLQLSIAAQLCHFFTQAFDKLGRVDVRVNFGERLERLWPCKN